MKTDVKRRKTMHKSYENESTPTWYKIALILLLLMTSAIFCSSIAHAEDPTTLPDKLVLTRIPEGRRLTVEGVQYMAYDLESFKELVEVELDLRDAESKLRLLDSKLELSEDRVTDLAGLHEKCVAALKAWEGVTVEPAEAPTELTIWILVGTNIATGAIVGVLAYVLVTR